MFAYGSGTMQPLTVKEEARRLVEGLSDDASWDDLMERIYTRMAVERGQRDSRAGRVQEVAEVRARFGLDP